MVTANADWGTYLEWHGEREVTTVHQARELCAQIEEHDRLNRCLVGFTTATGHFFAVGVGAGDSCAMFSESADPAYFQSKGTSPAEERIDFAYRGQHTRTAWDRPDQSRLGIRRTGRWGPRRRVVLPGGELEPAALGG